MINDEDTTCLMADPLSRDVAFGELLLWSLAGHIPPRYQPYITMPQQPSRLPGEAD